MNVERELQELREHIGKVQEWKNRHEDIEKELAKVWVDGGDILEAPELEVGTGEGDQ